MKIHNITTVFIAAAAVLLLCVPGSSANADAVRRWKVIVLVKEQHIAVPRIPDPAVETEISRQLIDAGYKVMDDGRIKELRYNGIVDRILRGGPDAARDVIHLGQKFGADVLVTGDAFTQVSSRNTVQTDLGSVVQIRCTARVELRAIRMDTGEKIYADAITKDGPPEATEELSSKSALQAAAEQIGPTIITKLDKLALPDSHRMEISVRGFKSLSTANAFCAVLGKLRGVSDVGDGEYEDGVFNTELSLTPEVARNFAARLETEPALARFHLRVESATKSKIKAAFKQ